jgi:hypothetical protein
MVALDRFRAAPYKPSTMTPISRLLLCGLALSLPARGLLLAAPPAEPRLTGRVLVLENERTLEGDIRREGEDYCIRRSGGEAWVSGRKVLCLCANWHEALAYLQRRANLADPDERVRLARWCQLHGLTREALDEVNAAVEMRPFHAEARRMLIMLQRAVQNENSSHPLSLAQKASNTLVKALPAVDLDTESIVLFVRRVQPILMNTCARCHAGGHGGSFTLLRCQGTAGPNHRATQHNLTAVLAKIDRQRPQLSPLLLKAVSIHGNNRQPPLAGRQSPPFRNLQEWVERVLAGNPHLVEETAQVEGAVKQPEPRLAAKPEFPITPVPLETTAPVQTVMSGRAAESGPAPVIAINGKSTTARTVPTVPLTERPVQVRVVPTTPALPPKTEPKAFTPDSFCDPDIFNRQMHPEKFPQETVPGK